MRLLITSLFLSVLLSLPGCLSDAGITDEEVKEFIKSLNDEEGDFLENIEKIDALVSLAELVEELAEGNITDTVEIRKKLNKELDDLAKTSPTIKKNKRRLRAAAEKYLLKKGKGSTGGEEKLSAASKEDIDQTKADLERLATSLNFMNWYGQTPNKVAVEKGDADVAAPNDAAAVKEDDEEEDGAGADDSEDEEDGDVAGKSLTANSLKLADFESNKTKGEHVIESPYFWVSFWNGYEAQKKSSSNTLDEAAIKSIFAKEGENGGDKTGLKEFVESIIDFATEASTSGSMSTKQKADLTAAITELNKEKTATKAVDNLENLIHHSLHYSINKKLEVCNVFTKADSGEFYFKNGIFTKDGVKKSVESKDSAELTKLASESIRNLMILKESIDKKMIPVLEGKGRGKPKKEDKAKAEKAKQVTRLEEIIKKIKSMFEVKTEFKVHIGSTKKHTSILTKEEIAKVGDKSANEILDGGSSTFLNSIRADDSKGVIPKLVEIATAVAG